VFVSAVHQHHNDSGESELQLFSRDAGDSAGPEAPHAIDSVPAVVEAPASPRVRHSRNAAPQRVRLASLRPHPLADGLVHRDHVDALRASLAAHGQIEPLIVAEDFTILDGHHRMRALSELAVPDVLVLIRPYASADPRATRDFHATQISRHRPPAERNLLLLRTLRQLAEHATGTRLPSRDELARLLGIDRNLAGKFATIVGSATPALLALFMTGPLPTAGVRTLHQLSQLAPESQARVVHGFGADVRWIAADAVNELREQLVPGADPDAVIDAWCSRVTVRLEEAAVKGVTAALHTVAKCVTGIRERLQLPARRAFDRGLMDAIRAATEGRLSPGAGVSSGPDAPSGVDAPRRGRRPR